jgi:hypothetical protein
MLTQRINSKVKALHESGEICVPDPLGSSGASRDSCFGQRHIPREKLTALCKTLHGFCPTRLLDTGQDVRQCIYRDAIVVRWINLTS